MKVSQISQLLGVKISNQSKKEALEISNVLLLRIIQLFKEKTFGIITFYGVNPKNIKFYESQLHTAENYLRIRGFNFMKIIVQWNIKFKDVMNFKEIGYFILNPNFLDMTEIAKKFDQSLFIYSKDKDAQVYYADGSKITLEKDSFEFGSIAEGALILNFIDFKLFIDSILDFDFQFLKKDEIKIDDRIVVFSKNKFTYETYLEIADVYDIRQNGIISFERSVTTPAIKPKVFHFDEIVWVIKISPGKETANLKSYKNAV